MAWARFGDNSATYPAVLATAGVPGVDPATIVNEVWGFIGRLMTISASHEGDYHVDIGTVYMVGGVRAAELIRVCAATNLMVEVERDGAKLFKLLEDPDYVHIRSRETVEWERDQRNNSRDVTLTVPIRMRDGDACRWCGILVHWRGRTSNRKGTFDHLVPGEDGTVETMVVACMRCNSSKKDNPDWGGKLRPVPERPIYRPATAQFLTDHGFPTQPNMDVDAAPGVERPALFDLATAPTRDGVRSESASLGSAPPVEPAPSSSQPRPRPPEKVPKKSIKNQLGSPPELILPGRVGSDQVGTDLAGQGWAGSGLEGSGSGAARTRRRRGKRRASPAATKPSQSSAPPF